MGNERYDSYLDVGKFTILTSKEGIVLMLTILTIYTVTLSQQVNYLMKVEECPSSGTEWKERTLELECKDNKTYHCLPYVQPDKTAKKEFYAGCILFLYFMPTFTGSCPQVRELNGDFAFENEKFMCTYGPDSCPPMDVKYRSDELYKYPGCLGKNETYDDESNKEITTYEYSSTLKPQSGPAGLSGGEIAGIVVGVIIAQPGILLLVVVVGCIICNKRRSSTRRSNQDKESNHTNGNAAQPLVTPANQDPNLTEAKSVLDTDAGDGIDDVQQDTHQPQETETPAGKVQPVINYYHQCNFGDGKVTNTNIENAGNVQQGNKNTCISSETTETL